MACAVSSSAWAMNPFSRRSRLRPRSRRASRTATWLLAVWARAAARAARAFSPSARVFSTMACWFRTAARDDLALFHLGVEVGEELLDLTGDLRADLDRDDGVERPGGGDSGGQRAAGHSGRAEGRAAADALAVEVAARDDRGAHCDHGEPEDTPLHMCQTGSSPALFLPATDGPLELGDGDPVVGQRLGLVGLGLGEGELGIGQLDDGAHPGV